MTNKFVPVRTDEATQRLMDELLEIYSSKSKIVSVAILALYLVHFRETGWLWEVLETHGLTGDKDATR